MSGQVGVRWRRCGVSVGGAGPATSGSGLQGAAVGGGYSFHECGVGVAHVGAMAASGSAPLRCTTTLRR
jgi:hypothetical protein